MSDTSPIITCTFHPNRETSLRCNRCEKPICSKCAIHTPTGYRCPECVKGIRKNYESALWYDYLLGFITAGVLSFIGSLIATALSFFIIIIAPIAGTIIAEAARFAIRKRRSKTLYLTIAAGALIGSLPQVILKLISTIYYVSAFGFQGFGSILSLLWPLLYSIIVTTTVYTQISGLIFKR